MVGVFLFEALHEATDKKLWAALLTHRHLHFNEPRVNAMYFTRQNNLGNRM